MATLSSGDTLSLNNLATATEQSTKSMGTCAGSTATPISMSAFAIDSVGTLGASDFTYVVESTSEDYTLAFGNEGGRFDKIKNLKRNFGKNLKLLLLILVGVDTVVRRRQTKIALLLFILQVKVKLIINV